MYVAYSRVNGWTDWAEYFCGHSWEAGECHRLKKLMLCFKQERKITQMEDIYILVNNIR